MLRADRDDIVVGETQPGERARTQVRDDDVGRRSDAQERRPSRFLFEVEHDTALVPHQVHRHARQLGVRSGSHEAVGVADRCLDRDDVGAEITECLGRERAHHDRAEVEDANAVEGTGRGAVVVIRLLSPRSRWLPFTIPAVWRKFSPPKTPRRWPWIGRDATYRDLCPLPGSWPGAMMQSAREVKTGSRPRPNPHGAERGS